MNNFKKSIVNCMNKKVILVILLLLILLVPIPNYLNDGGTVEYNAILYNLTKYHKLDSNSSTGYIDGIKVKILGFKIYEHMDLHEKEVNYSYNVYRGGYFRYKIIEKVDNIGKINDILNRIGRLLEDENIALDKYDDNYFNNQDLLFIYIPAASSDLFNLKEIKINDNINVYISQTEREVHTADLNGYLYLIEIDKTDKNLQVYFDENIIKSNCEFSRTYEVIEIKENGVIIKSFTNGDTHYFSNINPNYIKFEINKKYKFTFTPYGTPINDDSLQNMFLGNFILTKIEQIDEIINEDVCNIDI